MPSNLLSFDGKQFKSIGAGFGDAYYTSLDDWTTTQNQSVVGGLTSTAAYALVPWLYRGINYVCNAVSRMPYDLLNGADEDVKDRPEYASIMSGFRELLFATVGSRYLTGAWYWWPEANASGRNIKLCFLRSRFIRTKVESGKGLVGFRYEEQNNPDVPKDIPLDRVVYGWNVNYNTSTAPGIGEAQVALGAASMLYALDAFTAGFFNSGGVKVTVFEVAPTTQPADRDSFQAFLNRALSGVRNAFRNIVVRGGVKPTVIGSDVKETQAPQLTEIQRTNVAAALGVPSSIIDGKSSDDANSRSEKLGFYTETVIPITELIFEKANQQFFSKFGLRLVARPEKLEIMQSLQLSQVQAVNQAVGGAVMTRAEGRAFLDLPEEMSMPSQSTNPVPDESMMQSTPSAEAMATWRKLAIEAINAGKSADVPVDIRLPYALVKQIDAELRQAKSASQVRAVFDRHWPKADDTHETDDELKRANDLLERLLPVLNSNRTPSFNINLPSDLKASLMMPEVKAPDVIVNLPPMQPVIRPADVPPIVIPAPVVNVEAVAQPANVTVNTPRIATESKVVTRDAQGEITGSEATYEYKD